MLADAFLLAAELESHAPQLKADLDAGKFLAYDHAEIAKRRRDWGAKLLS